MKEDKPMSYYEELFQYEPEILKLYKRKVAMKKVFGKKIVDYYEKEKSLFVAVLYVVVCVIFSFYMSLSITQNWHY